MVAASPGKTPISLLQEYGTRLGRTPGYDLLKAEGQAHQPNFTFRVTLGDISCTGQGPSKKAAKGWRLPEYTVTQESGPAHRKEFTMTCRVERFVEIGSGTSKKLAKRNAAAKMLVRIHNVPMEPRDGSEAEGEEDQFNMVLGALGGTRHPRATAESPRVTQSHLRATQSHPEPARVTQTHPRAT
ncbi:RISC-loading complex subunit TARBP2 [Lonchura striata]|uniref:RISC-loading complex subunit TARBP2 n=1 Tax=Lonchura striata TaxID=40157 RepID=A0A218U933_9PASE|nr:RISC-loading complex subunit TARBP2 [Lonchura striata domestica]